MFLGAVQYWEAHAMLRQSIECTRKSSILSLVYSGGTPGQMCLNINKESYLRRVFSESNPKVLPGNLKYYANIVK